MRREEMGRAIQAYAQTNPGAVIIFIEDNPDGSVSVQAVPNVAGLIDVQKSGANLTSGQAYALSALVHIAKKAREERNKSASRIYLPPGVDVS